MDLPETARSLSLPIGVVDMSSDKLTPAETLSVAEISTTQRLGAWLEDPLRQVVAASVATIGSLGVVLSGIWFVNLALN